MKLLDNRQAAAFISENYFEVSHRTLDVWPDLPGRIINRRKWHTVEEVVKAARGRIEAAEQRRYTLSTAA